MPTDIRLQYSAFDPFGERVDGMRVHAAVPAGRRARIVAAATFWSLALFLVAGRVHLAGHPAPTTAAHTAIQVSDNAQVR